MQCTGKGSNIIDVALIALNRGILDEFFENLIKFVAETMKRDFTTVIKILSTFEGDYITPEQAAERAVMDRTSAYILLEELYKFEILEKIKKGKEDRYRIIYPLLST